MTVGAVVVPCRTLDSSKLSRSSAFIKVLFPEANSPMMLRFRFLSSLFLRIKASASETFFSHFFLFFSHGNHGIVLNLRDRNLYWRNGSVSILLHILQGFRGDVLRKLLRQRVFKVQDRPLFLPVFYLIDHRGTGSGISRQDLIP